MKKYSLVSIGCTLSASFLLSGCQSTDSEAQPSVQLNAENVNAKTVDAPTNSIEAVHSLQWQSAQRFLSASQAQASSCKRGVRPKRCKTLN